LATKKHLCSKKIDFFCLKMLDLKRLGVFTGWMNLIVACLMGFSDLWDNDWLNNDELGNDG